MPVTQLTRKSISRVFYSSNTQAYEVGWRGSAVAVRVVWPGTLRQFPSTNVSSAFNETYN